LYGEIDLKDPQNPILSQSGNNMVLRGGSWCNRNPDYLRGAYRFNLHPEGRSHGIGFRLAEDLK
jgi:formylglycine-generating enzyme required for sulfatase activity